jgi:hypothetical protein
MLNYNQWYLNTTTIASGTIFADSPLLIGYGLFKNNTIPEAYSNSGGHCFVIHINAQTKFMKH